MLTMLRTLYYDEWHNYVPAISIMVDGRNSVDVCAWVFPQNKLIN